MPHALQASRPQAHGAPARPGRTGAGPAV